MSVEMSSNSGQFRANDGDWVCDEPSCANVNFARRQNCNLCGRERLVDLKHANATDKSKRKLGHEIGKAAAEKSKGLFSADDWQCGRCGNVNWARRQQCNMCNAPKFGDNEQRTGLGGGYNERENVEYIEREESDSEYDDFGRKKKKIRRDNDSSNDAKQSSDDNSNDGPKKASIDANCDKDSTNDVDDNEEDEEEDDDDADVSKYKLDSGDDEEEEDEEEDSDGDLSKYDLSDWSKTKDDGSK